MAKPEALTGAPLEILVKNKKIEYEIKTKAAKGHISASDTHTIKFVCAKPFAIFIKEFTPAAGTTAKPHGWVRDSYANQSPFSDRGPVYRSDGNNELSLTVSVNQSQQGEYTYSVVVLDDDGTFVSDDPQIIIQ